MISFNYFSTTTGTSSPNQNHTAGEKPEASLARVCPIFWSGGGTFLAAGSRAVGFSAIHRHASLLPLLYSRCTYHVNSPKSLHESEPVPVFPLPRWTATGSVGCDIPARGSLPQQPGGSASMTSLSRPAQDSLALRPTRLQQHLSCYLAPRLRHGRLPRRTAWVATEVNRKLLGPISHPLVLHAFVAHWLSPVSA
jgi:hypothetical protein